MGCMAWREDILLVTLAGTFRGLSQCNVVYKSVYKSVKSKVIFYSRRSNPNTSTEISNITTKSDSGVWISFWNFLSRFVHDEIVKYKKVISQWISLEVVGIVSTLRSAHNGVHEIHVSYINMLSMSWNLKSSVQFHVRQLSCICIRMKVTNTDGFLKLILLHSSNNW